MLELHVDRLASGGVIGAVSELEVLHSLKMKEAGNDARGKGGKFDGEVANISVVKSAGGLDFVFGVLELALKLEEILIGLEIRIGFGYGEEAAEGVRKLALGFCAGGETSAARAYGRASRGRHFLK